MNHDMDSKSTPDELTHLISQKSIYTAPIETVVSHNNKDTTLIEANYPHRITLKVTVTCRVPSDTRIEDCEILAIRNQTILLSIVLKHGRVFLKSCDSLGSPLMTILLEVLGKDERLCLETAQEKGGFHGKKEYSRVELQMSLTDEPTELRIAAGKPIGRLETINLLINLSGSTASEIETLLANSPLGRPLRKGFEKVLYRMLRGFLKRWPNVFNRLWREKIMDGFPLHISIARSVSQISHHARDANLLADLKNASENRPVIEVLTQDLCTLHKALQRPLVRSEKPRVQDLSDLEEDLESDDDQKKEKNMMQIDTDEEKVLELDSETEEILDCHSVVSSSSLSLTLGYESSEREEFDDGLI